ncbi:hypothetical protein REPUB_Repub16aG0113000 [Reevesia pubescens]
MDPKVYKAVITSDVAALHQLASSDLTVLLQVTIQEDNILHVAAKYDLKQMTEEIIKFPPLVSLVNQKHSKGDTPLHIAARLGNLRTAEVLINCANSMSREIEAGERLIRMVNMEKDTALHDAVRNGHVQIAELLSREDPELTLITNDVGESPLFIAVDKKHVDIAKHILQVAPVCSFGGRNNMNVLHAAVVRSQDEGNSSLIYSFIPGKVLRLSSYMVKFQSPMNYVTNMSFKDSFKFSSFGPSAIIQAAFRDAFYKDFVACLMEKCQSALSETDEFGWTPLHYGAVDIFKLFLENIDPSTVYIRDKEGMFVTHIASREGEVVVLKMLAYLYPEIWDLQDNKGQTVFHLAVSRGKLDAVKFILGTKLSHDGLINQKDNEGKTALHLATIQGHNRKIFDLLIKDSRVDKTVTNMEGLTVIDIILLKEYGFYEKRRDPASDTQVEGQQQLAKRKTEPAGLKKPKYEQLQNIASINLLVTTLIATVSFAAGFTMPGGYNSGGPDEGMAILSRKSAFRVFVISNALAFCFSSTSMFIHYCKSFVEKLDVLAFFTYITSLLTSYGITAMVIAFISGTYATLSDSPGLAKAVLSIGCSFFALQLLVYLK